MNNVLILMPRLSDYMLSCFRQWVSDSRVTLHIVHRLTDQSAPYEFSMTDERLFFYAREGLKLDDLKMLERRVKPSLIICFGWMDNCYLSLVRTRTRSCTCVMTMDGQWSCKPRQVLALLWARLRLTPFFHYVWVPGERQKRFANLLGFSKKRIFTGLYVANNHNFKPIWENLNGSSPKKRLVYVGRYIPEKGISQLCKSFADYCDTTSSDLELWCFGTGPLEDDLVSHRQIIHHGFLQPHQFVEKLSGGGVFILPSEFEPWGVVVHEFASAGFPLILTVFVGASDLFLSKENGLLLRKISDESLLEAFEFVDGLNDLQLLEMGKASKLHADQLTMTDWCSQAQAFLERCG